MMEFSLGFGVKSVGHELFTEFDVKARVCPRIGTGKLLLCPPCHLRGQLAEGVFLIVALDALKRRLRGGAGRYNTVGARGARQRVEQRFSLGVARVMIKRCLQFACRRGSIAGPVKRYSQVEVIVSLARVVLDRSLEI